MPHLRPSRDSIPSSLRIRTRWQLLGTSQIPALLVHPDWSNDTAEPSAPLRSAPVMIWIHGRTASKELDPGRYLRWMRAGIAVCAVDLPGHGERFDQRSQEAESTLEVVSQMVEEVDEVVAALSGNEGFDGTRIALGGMSAGGMVTLARLCRRHPFRCASVEATTGSWRWQNHRAMWNAAISNRLNPIAHLDAPPEATPSPSGHSAHAVQTEGWRDIPLQAIHARADEWVSITGQEEFIEALRDRASDPDRIEFVIFDRTGAPAEHIGFGTFAAEAKDRQLAFLQRWL